MVLVGEAGDDSKGTSSESGPSSAWGSLEVMSISGQSNAGPVRTPDKTRSPKQAPPVPTRSNKSAQKAGDDSKGTSSDSGTSSTGGSLEVISRQSKAGAMGTSGKARSPKLAPPVPTRSNKSVQETRDDSKGTSSDNGVDTSQRSLEAMSLSSVQIRHKSLKYPSGQHSTGAAVMPSPALATPLSISEQSKAGTSKLSKYFRSKKSGIDSQYSYSASQEWKLLKSESFGKEGDKAGQFRLACGIAVCKNGNIAVADSRKGSPRVYLFEGSGKPTYKFTFQSHPTNPEGKLLYPNNVAATPDGDIVISDKSALLKIFSGSGDYLKSISAAPELFDNNITEHEISSVAVAPSGEVCVGDAKRRVITLHNRDRHQQPQRLSIPIQPYYLACESDDLIIWASDCFSRKVIRLSRTGDVLCRIVTFMVGGTTGSPHGVAHIEDNVYIAVMVDETGNGQIHQYTIGGQFQRCIVTRMYAPRGLAIANGKLYVANTKSVSVYGPK
ncbi:uncharacterized protein [Amphiura filiformis]|uniref:uncharacterized protein n=1 Tax=Amphiura filiformis TaxID=82378 RepID=UPI003B225F3B